MLPGTWELHDGIPVLKYESLVRPRKEHIETNFEIQTRLKRQLAGYTDCKVYGEPNYRPFPDQPTVYEPDFVVVCEEEWMEYGLYLVSTPLVIGEITSPSTKSRDYSTKREAYRLLGLQHYLIVDIQKQEIHYDHFTWGQEGVAQRVEITLDEACGVKLKLGFPFI